jgi:RNA polymerase sigma factor (sigma-70 family)
VAVRADSWLRQGDPNENRSGAFASDLFEQHSEMVLGVCRLLLADPVEAEDATQQTFFSAYRSILAGSEPHRPAAWLATIARNECLDRIRGRTRAPLVAERVPGDARAAPDALNAVIAREDLYVLGRTINELPTQQREALLLHEFHGLPYRDVAATIGVSESAIASLLFRARARLRSVLHRAYATLPVPALWNGADHLFGRGSCTSIAALPVVAKVGAAAVAVGLTTGAAIVVEHDVNTHDRPSPSAHVHRSAPSPAASAPKEALRQTRLTPFQHPVSRSAIVPPTIRTQAHTRSPAKGLHSVPPARAATSNNAPHQQAALVSLPERRRSEASPVAGQTSNSGSTQHRSSPGNKALHPHRNDKPSAKTPSETSGDDARAPKPGGGASPSRSARGNPAGNAHSQGMPAPNENNGGGPPTSQQTGNGPQSNANTDQRSGPPADGGDAPDKRGARSGPPHG